MSTILFNPGLIDLALQLPTNIQVSIYGDNIRSWALGIARVQLRDRLQRAVVIAPKYLKCGGLEGSPVKSVAIAFTRQSMKKYP